jgi:hypothetical protein
MADENEDRDKLVASMAGKLAHLLNVEADRLRRRYAHDARWRNAMEEARSWLDTELANARDSAAAMVNDGLPVNAADAEGVVRGLLLAISIVENCCEDAEDL